MKIKRRILYVEMTWQKEKNNYLSWIRTLLKIITIICKYILNLKILLLQAKFLP